MKSLVLALAVFCTLLTIVHCFVFLGQAIIIASEHEGNVKFGIIYLWITLASIFWGFFIIC